MYCVCQNARRENFNDWKDYYDFFEHISGSRYFERVAVQEGFCGDFVKLNEFWYVCVLCGDVKRLIEPDPPFAGLCNSVNEEKFGTYPLYYPIGGYFAGGRATLIKMTQPLSIYRAWSLGVTKEFGKFWLVDEPSGSMESSIMMSIKPEWLKTKDGLFSSKVNICTKIVIPIGCNIFVGIASNLGGIWNGGGCPLLFLDPLPEWKVYESALV